MASPDRWYFGVDVIQSTPSRKCGFDHDKELSCRQQAANFIQDMGQRLQVTQLCINTAIVYMHRFYMFHSFSQFQRTALASAALFLAAKVEEQPRKLEHVIRVSQICLHREHVPIIDVKSEQYNEQAQDLITNENILLQTLGFDVAIDHPHTHIVRCCQLVKASKDLAQTSYFMASYSLHLTTMCLQYKPTVVACFCIHLACKWSNWEIPESSEGRPWFWYVDKLVTQELLESLTTEFLTLFEKCPSRLKKKIMSLSYQQIPSTPNNSLLTPQQQAELDKRKESNRLAIESHVPTGMHLLPSSAHPTTTPSTSAPPPPHPHIHPSMGVQGGGGGGSGPGEEQKKREREARMSGGAPTAAPTHDYKKHHHHHIPHHHHHSRDNHGMVPSSKSSCMFGPGGQPIGNMQNVQKSSYHNNAIPNNMGSTSYHSMSSGGSNSGSSSGQRHPVKERADHSSTAAPPKVEKPVRPSHVRNGDIHHFQKKFEIKSEPVDVKPVIMPPPVVQRPRPRTPPPQPPPPPIKQERSIFSPEEKVAVSPPPFKESPPPIQQPEVKPASPASDPEPTPPPQPPPPPTTTATTTSTATTTVTATTTAQPNGEQPSSSPDSRAHKKKKKKHKEHKDRHKDKHKHKHKPKDPGPIRITIPKEKIAMTQPPDGLKIKIAKDKISPPPPTGLKIKIPKDKLKESRKRERSEESDVGEPAAKHHHNGTAALQVGPEPTSLSRR